MIKILYEDKNIVALDKPSGLSVHADAKNTEDTLAHQFVKIFPDASSVGEGLFVEGKEIKRPGVVHRLDKETSGVILFAKNQEAHAFLKKQFQERSIKKVYHCIVSGFIRDDYGRIDKPIGRSPSDFRKRLAGRGARGQLREAVTDYKVLNRFEDEKGNKFTYLEVKPKTGRTHQIRVHMKFLNHPIVMDALYNKNGESLSGVNHMALHAFSIDFENMEGDIVHVESTLPLEFAKYMGAN